MRRFFSSREAEQGNSADVDLEQAAVIFLRGHLDSERVDEAAVDTADQAVRQVARTLVTCSPASIVEIRHAVTLFRSDPSPGARNAVIEEVARAAAELQTTPPTTTKEK